MTAPPLRDFPLFPLGIVALPTESVPLHIFEDRYLRMIEHCLEGEGSEGSGSSGSPTRSSRTTGCACAVEQVLERTAGRAHEHPRRAARGRSGCSSARTTSPTRPAWSSSLADEPEEPDERGRARSARELYAELVAQATDRELGRPRSSPSSTPTAWPAPSSSSSKPSRSCSSCAPRTPGCGCWRRCCSGDRAPGAARARAGARAVERQGPLRLTRGPGATAGRWQSCWAACSTSSCSLCSTAGWPGELSENPTVPSASRT